MSLKGTEKDKKSNKADGFTALMKEIGQTRPRGKWYRRISIVLTLIVIIWLFVRMLAF